MPGSDTGEESSTVSFVAAVVFGVGNDMVVVVVGVMAMTLTAVASAVVVSFGGLVAVSEVVVTAVGEVVTALDKLAHGFDTGNKLIWNRGG